MKKQILYLMFATAALCAACGDDDKGYQAEVIENPVTGISIDNDLFNDDNVIILEGLQTTTTFQVNLNPGQAGDAERYYFKFSSSNENIFTVNQQGVITSVGPGEAELTVTPVNNAQLQVKYKVVVMVYVEEIQVPEEEIELGKNETYNLANYVKVLPDNATYPKLRYTSSNESVATVGEEDGIITGVGVGEAVITVSTTDGTTISEQCNINVVIYQVETINIIGGATKGLEVGGTLNLSSYLAILPANATDKSVSYSISEGADVVSLEEGVITALKVGKAVITITANDGSGVSTDLTVNSSLWYNRSQWSIDTSITYGTGNNYVIDGTTGKPEDLFDGSATTFISLTKPGINYNGCLTPAGHLLYFVVDMKQTNPFNCIRWTNRAAAGLTGVHLRKIRLLGSNDNSSFTVIQERIVLDHNNITSAQEIVVPASEYRYVKVELTDYVQSPNSTLQLSEFAVGSR